MIAIYKISFYFILFVSSFSILKAETKTDINSFCFNKNIKLKDVHQSLMVLLLPLDIVDFRNKENCLDIITTSARGKLFEKFLSKRFKLKNESPAENAISITEDCHIDLKSTQKNKSKNKILQIGKKNSVKENEIINSSVSTIELLIGAGKIGEIEIANQHLNVECQVLGAESAHLVFSYSDKNKSTIHSELLLKKGEWINIGSVLSELKNKTKNIGIPQIELGENSEIFETIYELQFK